MTQPARILALPAPPKRCAAAPSPRRRLNHALAALAAAETALDALNRAVAVLSLSERSAFALASSYVLLERRGDRFAPCGGIPMETVIAKAPPSAAIGRATEPPIPWASRAAKAPKPAKPSRQRPVVLLSIEDLL
jgi:hypothetical protein